MNIYESKHIWLGIPTNNNWDNYVKKNKKLINIVKKESENDYEEIQNYVLKSLDWLSPLNRSEGGFCLKNETPRESEKSQLRWKSEYKSGDKDWFPSNNIFYKNCTKEQIINNHMKFTTYFIVVFRMKCY